MSFICISLTVLHMGMASDGNAGSEVSEYQE